MMPYIQYLPHRSVKKWALSDMNSRFTTAIEAGKVVDELRRQLKTINYNNDLHKLLRNIDKQVSDLSSAEVIARQSHKPRLVEEPIKKLQESIDYFEKLILIAKLSQ